MSAPSADTRQTVDVLVVGAGGAGMTAALVAATRGCKVLVCETTEQVGGTTARSFGVIWVPDSDASDSAAPDLTQKRDYLQALLEPSDLPRGEHRGSVYGEVCASHLVPSQELATGVRLSQSMVGSRRSGRARLGTVTGSVKAR